MCAVLDPDDDMEPEASLLAPIFAQRGADSGDARDDWRAKEIERAVARAGSPPLQPITRFLAPDR